MQVTTLYTQVLFYLDNSLNNNLLHIKIKVEESMYSLNCFEQYLVQAIECLIITETLQKEN